MRLPKRGAEPKLDDGAVFLRESGCTNDANTTHQRINPRALCARHGTKGRKTTCLPTAETTLHVVASWVSKLGWQRACAAE